MNKSNSSWDSSTVGLQSTLRCERTDRLKVLTAEATLNYSIKDFDTAAELYSQATELQAELNGEMSLQNIDLLYSYGRCLYQVALKKSDVLGSKIVAEKREETSQEASGGNKKKVGLSERGEEESNMAEEVVMKAARGNTEIDMAESKVSAARKSYFQFDGDKSLDSSSEDYDVEDERDANNICREEQTDGKEDEEDDFVTAYEILDLARVLLAKQLEETQKGVITDATLGDSRVEHDLKERLADTYDLQAEISLEGERFPNAVTDLKSALKLKQELFPLESSIIAEAHYKLSLALEFSSVTHQKSITEEAKASLHTNVDDIIRKEAANQMEAAIESCRMRIKKEEATLTANASKMEENAKLKGMVENIADVKEMIQEMEHRVRIF